MDILIPSAVPEAEHNDLTSPWFIFNDFVVNNVSEDEALSFPDRWKASYSTFASQIDSDWACRFLQLFTLKDLTCSLLWTSDSFLINLTHPSFTKTPLLPCS